MKNRKKEHLEIVMEEDVTHSYNYWDDFMLLHNALPEINIDEIDLSTEIFGKKLSMPLIIAGMTGGFEEAKKINEGLARIAEKFGIGMGVGSQRAGLEDAGLVESYSVVKNYRIPLRIANIGAPQLLEWKDAVEKANKAIEMIDAHVLAVHLNFLQEVIQPEGDRNAKGCLNMIKEISSSLDKPVIVKETGAGISRKVVEKLLDTDIVGIDVGGAGGTSFSAVESYRARKIKDRIQEEIGKIFWDWGIPTPYCLIEISEICRDAGIEIIATGGIKHGLDVAKSIALGADCAGVASAILKSKSMEEKMEIFRKSLLFSLFLTGCKNIEELREVEIWSI
ncbi:MAG: type 2 isopentenyl-diphosphate Delta-isomerase [Thermoplasmatales archaeon]|nr:type 2 isopentenyl-diphosphate Delta-isomerase [Thermoplasmatales archaeon]